MKKSFAMAVVVAALTACGGRDGVRITTPEGPKFDGGGVGFGSGHRDGGDSTRIIPNATAQEGGSGGFGSGH
jgi:hypothetical protein